MKNKSLLFGFILFTLLGSFSCLKENNGSINGEIIAFSDTMGIKGVFATCGRCHGSGGDAVGEWFYNPNDYQRSIKKHIDNLNKECNTFGKKMASPKYANLTQAQVDIFNAWYTAGYPNGPTLAKVSFTHNPAKTIFDNSCASCHSAGQVAANSWIYDPTNYYTSIKAYLNRFQVRVVDKKDMPPNGLSNSELQSIQDWLTAGGLATN